MAMGFSMAMAHGLLVLGYGLHWLLVLGHWLLLLGHGLHGLGLIMVHAGLRVVGMALEVGRDLDRAMLVQLGVAAMQITLSYHSTCRNTANINWKVHGQAEHEEHVPGKPDWLKQNGAKRMAMPEMAALRQASIGKNPYTRQLMLQMQAIMKWQLWKIQTD